jgi:hypothetical protein
MPESRIDTAGLEGRHDGDKNGRQAEADNELHHPNTFLQRQINGVLTA